MTHPIPQPGRYREKDTDCTFDTPLGTFWDKYEEISG
jgi:hypothetical protein